MKQWIFMIKRKQMINLRRIPNTSNLMVKRGNASSHPLILRKCANFQIDRLACPWVFLEKVQLFCSGLLYKLYKTYYSRKMVFSNPNVIRNGCLAEEGQRKIWLGISAQATYLKNKHFIKKRQLYEKRLLYKNKQWLLFPTKINVFPEVLGFLLNHYAFNNSRSVSK